MNRRALLRTAAATAGLSASGGCLFGGGGGHGIEVERVESLADYASTSAEEFTGAQAALVEGARTGGEHVTYGHRPFADGEYVEADGEFYRTRVERTGGERVTRWVLGADEVDGSEAEEASGEAVPVRELPSDEREPAILACRLAHVRAREDDGRDAPPDRYVHVFRGVSEEETIWLPEPRHEVVEYGGRVYRLWTGRRELDEDEFATTLERVAPDAEGFERRVEDEFVVDLDARDLPEEQREIVETAIAEGEYTESGHSSPEFGDLVRTLQEESSRRRSLLKYEGEYYDWSSWHSD